MRRSLSVCAVNDSAPNNDTMARSDIETARIGAERGVDQPLAVAGETAPADGAAAARDPRLRMQVACDFAIAEMRRRFVTERQRAERQRFRQTGPILSAGSGS